MSGTRDVLIGRLLPTPDSRAPILIPFTLALHHPLPSSLDVVPPDFLEAIVPGRQDVEVLDVRRRRRAPRRVVEEDERGIVKVDALDIVVHLLALVRIELPFRVLDQLFYLVILVAGPDCLCAAF